MQRFLGYWSPQNCEILHLPRPSKSKQHLFLKKEKEKRKPRRRKTRVVRNWELLNWDGDKFRLLWEFGTGTTDFGVGVSYKHVSRSGGVEGSAIGYTKFKTSQRQLLVGVTPRSNMDATPGVMPRVKRGGVVLKRATNPARVWLLRISPQDDLQTRATLGLVFAGKQRQQMWQTPDWRDSVCSCTGQTRCGWRATNQNPGNEGTVTEGQCGEFFPP